MLDPYGNFEHATLANGLNIHVLHIPGMSWARVRFAIHSGAKHDLPGLEGCAHFMEHLVCQNGGSTLQDLLDYYETTSGHHPLLGRTGFHSTEYGFCSPIAPATFSQSLQYFGDMLLHAQLRQHVERERAVIRGEFHQKFNAPYEHDLLLEERQAVFPDTYFSRTVTPLGTLQTIETITQFDLQGYYDTHYVPQNMSVVVVGGLSLKEIITFFERSSFAVEKEGGRSAVGSPTLDPPRPPVSRLRFDLSMHHPGMTTAEYRSVAQLPGVVKPHAVGILRRMLFKELFRELREVRAWTYGVGIHNFDAPEFVALFIESHGLNVEALDAIEDLVDGCIARLADRDDLFASSKAHRLAVQQYADRDTDEIAAGAVNDLVSCGRITSVAEEVEDIESITMADIADLVGWLTPDRRRTLIQHP